MNTTQQINKEGLADDPRVKMSPREYLEDLASKNSSDGIDQTIMAILLRKCGFPNVVITCGIVYAEGHGTLDCPPVSIHAMANTILKANSGA